jgi:hypothetical protein
LAQKTGWATFWAIFSQTLPVALLGTLIASIVKKSFFDSALTAAASKQVRQPFEAVKSLKTVPAHVFNPNRDTSTYRLM